MTLTDFARQDGPIYLSKKTCSTIMFNKTYGRRPAEGIALFDDVGRRKGERALKSRKEPRPALHFAAALGGRAAPGLCAFQEGGRPNALRTAKGIALRQALYTS